MPSLQKVVRDRFAYLKMYSGSSSTTSTSPRRSMAFIRDCTNEALLALNLNLSTKACRNDSPYIPTDSQAMYCDPEHLVTFPLHTPSCVTNILLCYWHTILKKRMGTSCTAYAKLMHHSAGKNSKTLPKIWSKVLAVSTECLT